MFDFSYAFDRQLGRSQNHLPENPCLSPTTLQFQDDLEAELEELEGAELEEQLLLPVATVSAAPEHDITGLLPAPLFLRGQTRRMNLLICRLRWHFGQVDLFLYFQELLLSISLLLVYY